MTTQGTKRTPWLLTGVTSGLGAATLHHLLHTQHYPASDIIATSRSESNRARFEAQGLQFRLLDYSDPTSLASALENVENFFFVASPERDTAVRNAEHANVIAAARDAKVSRVWYNSLAFGGFEDASAVGFQQAHYETERQLLASGVDFVSLRAGLYADAFPLFLNWYPSSPRVFLPNLSPPTTKGLVAFASREELGEAHAALFAKGFDAFPSIRPHGDKNIVLLTGPEPESLDSLVGAIGKARGTDLPVQHLEPRDWIEEEVKDDEGGKPRGWFEAKLVFVQGICDGDAERVDGAMEVLLGRRPLSGTQAVEGLVRADPGYTWHQNHMSKQT